MTMLALHTPGVELAVSSPPLMGSKEACGIRLSAIVTNIS